MTQLLGIIWWCNLILPIAQKLIEQKIGGPDWVDRISSKLDSLLTQINAGEIRLGLDLQGGSYLLLKVQAEALQEDRLNNIASELRMKLRQTEPKIGYKNIGMLQRYNQIHPNLIYFHNCEYLQDNPIGR